MTEQSACNLGSPDTRPWFYKIIWLDNLFEMQIPANFKKHLMNAQTDQVTLKTGARKWEADLSQNEEGDMFLSQGWKELSEYHALGNAEFLVFKYNGDMSFDVEIYDKSGCVRNYQSVETSHQVLAFASCFPFFKYEIKGYNLGSKYFLPIPHEFSRRNLRMSKQMMILRNSEGVSWQVNITLNSVKGLAMCGGWKSFSDSNSIKNGDVCIFELIEKNVMKVHIFK